ncbi:MAG: hypothetical protein SW833_27250 [Cyanobacteriota bacterium]|nr:hypothetical protein [Cyanobacteriota bacterium]
MPESYSSQSKLARDRDSISKLKLRFSTPKRLAVIGSLSFSHPATEKICQAIGQKLADFCDLIVITGGVAGVPEAVSRSLWQRRQTVSTGGSSVYHVQPQGFEAWDYGENLTAGATLVARRQILATLSPLYLLLEGGLGAEQEARLALRQGALLIPVGFTGGVARALWHEFSEQYCEQLEDWSREDRCAWTALESRDFDIDDTVQGVITLVQRSMRVKGYPLGVTPATASIAHNDGYSDNARGR